MLTNKQCSGVTSSIHGLCCVICRFTGQIDNGKRQHMEISKISAVRLTVVSIVAAVLCMASIGAIGLCFMGYWNYTETVDLHNESLASLKNEIDAAKQRALESKAESAEMETMLKRHSGELVKYIALTNEIHRLHGEKNVALGNLIAITNHASQINEALRESETRIEKLKADVADLEGKRDSLEHVEGLLKKKEQEIGRVSAELGAKGDELRNLSAEIDRVRDSQLVATSNLTATLNKAEGVRRVISEKETLKAKLEDDISKLNAEVAGKEQKKKELENEIDALDRRIKIRTPQAKELMDRLAGLAGECIASSNKLSEVRLQLVRESAEAHRKLDGELAEKRARASKEIEERERQIKEREQQIEEREQTAREAVAAAEGRAAKIIADAKTAAEAISKGAESDKAAAERVRKERVEAELSAARAIKERDAAMKEMAESESRVASLTSELSKLQGEVKAAKSELEKARVELTELRATEGHLSNAIQAKRKVLAALDSESVADSPSETTGASIEK